MGRPRKERPGWWTPEFVIDWLRENPDRSARELCDEKADEIGIAALTLYTQDIAGWRKNHTGLREAIRLHAVDKAVAAGGTRPLDLSDPDWREKWVAAYLETGTKEGAAKAIGCVWANLWPKTREGHPRYDEKFAKMVEEAEQKRIAVWEDDLEWARQEAKDQGDARTIANTALSVLERLHKKRWSRSEERTMTHQGTVVHEHRIAVEQQKALAQAAETSRRLFAPREPAALPSGQRQAVELPVLEAEVVEG